MKRTTRTRLVTMMAACALVANAAHTLPAHAQGMPPAAHEIVDTMRPMYVAQDTASASNPDADAYGGSASGKSDSSGDKDGNTVSQ